MICCREFVHTLIEFIDGELPDERCIVIEEHLRICPPCLAYLNSYRLMITLSRKLPAQPLPEALVQRLRTALAEAASQSDE